MWKILIVDDEPILADGLYYYLKRQQEYDFEPMRVYSGEEAMRLVLENKFDLVISDICMPDLDGLRLLEIIKRLWPTTRVIMLTGHREFDYIYTSSRYEGVRYLMKAENFSGILEVILSELHHYDEQMQNIRQAAQLRDRVNDLLPLLQQTILCQILMGRITSTSQDVANMRLAGLQIDPAAPVVIVLGRMDMDNAALISNGAAMQVSNINVVFTSRLEHLRLTFHFVWNGTQIIWLIQCAEKTELTQLHEIYSTLYNTLPDIQVALEYSELPMTSFFIYSQWITFDQIPQVYEQLLGASASPQHMDEGALVQVYPLRSASRREHYLDYDGTRTKQLSFFLRMGKRSLFLQGVEPLIDQQNLSSQCIRHNMFMIASLLFSELGMLPHGTDEYYKRFQNLLACPKPAHAFLAYVRDVADFIYTEREHLFNTEKDNVISMVNGFIDLHYTEDIPLIRIAEFAGYNPSYLSRLYKLKTGENIGRRISRLRIEHAKRLLREGDESISVIAQQVGVDSTKYFISMFKNETGLTPQQYRSQPTDAKE